MTEEELAAIEAREQAAKGKGATLKEAVISLREGLK